MNEFRQAVRQLRKHPFSNAVIVLTIALLVGAVSVIYASLRDQRARYTPFPEADRIVKLWRTGANRNVQYFKGDLYQGYIRELTSFQDLGALDQIPAATLTEVGEPVSYHGAAVTPSLLRLAGMKPVTGQLFDDGDTVQGDDRIVLISEQMWREKLGADEKIIGGQLRLNNQLSTVVGVLPAFMRTTRLAYNIDVWRPLYADRQRSGGGLRLFGRLKPGVTMAKAQAELDTVAPALEGKHVPGKHERAVYPNGFTGARITSLNTQLAQSNRGTPAEVILVYVFAGLLVASVVGIACFNVANLLLARVTSRSREIAIRIAIGAGRGRIIRQLLGETVLLSLLGGVAGLLISFWLFELLKLQHVDVRMDWRLYLIATAGAILLGVLVGLLPAVRSAKTDLTDVLKDGGQSAGRRRHRLRNFLVTSEIAMALILCVVAGLLTRSYLWIQNQELGFQPAKVLSMRVNLRQDVYRSSEDRSAYIDRGLLALREVPGVESAAVLIGGGMFDWSMSDLITLPATADRKEQLIGSELVYGGHGTPYFNTTRLLRGRDLSERSAKAANEVLINETFSQEYFANRNPLGQRIRLQRNDHWMTIVGVVTDRHPLTNYREPRPEVIVGHRNLASTVPIHFMTHTRADAKAMAQPLREALQSLNANQPVNQVVFISDLLEKRSRSSQTGMVLLGAFAAVGLFIALMGVYGVVAFTVMERTREVGIRMAVGATRGATLRLMLWQGARLILLGAIPGMLIASGMLTAIPSKALILGISPFDPMTYAVTLLVVGIAGVAACLLPARKAANLNPMEALRHE